LGEAKSVPTERICQLCKSGFNFNEDESLYEEICDRCGKSRYPLAYALRSKLKEHYGAKAARDVFGEEHGDYLPESMILDEARADIIRFFKTIGHVVAEAAGLPEQDHAVIAEPSCDDDYYPTSWLIIRNPPSMTEGPTPGKSHLVFFRCDEPWKLGEKEEDEVEKLLEDWRDVVKAAVKESRFVETAVERLKAVEFKRIGHK
jgi:hypothetical protein